MVNELKNVNLVALLPDGEVEVTEVQEALVH
jgi:hypothetical protein